MVLLVAGLWGSTYTLLRVGMQHSPPFLFAALRTGVGGACLVATAIALARPIPVGWRLHGKILIAGVLNYAVFYAGMNIGLQHISAGETSVLVYTEPLWMALFAWRFLDQPLSVPRVIGLLLGLLGVGLVVSEKMQPQAGAAWGAYLVVLVAALAWAIGAVMFLRWLSGVPLEWAVGLQNLYASASLIPVWLLAEGGRLPDGSPEFWWTFAFTSLLSSYIAQLAFFGLLRMRAAAVVGAYSFLTPVVAAGTGFLFLQERISPLTLLGGGCVVLGIVLVNRPIASRIVAPD
jgi:O-acetylserine/cysteine efflux transporter